MCRSEGPGTAAVAAQYDGRVNIVGVPGRGSVEEMRRFVSETGTDRLTNIVDADGALWQRFDVVQQPAWAFVGTDGKARTYAGSLDEGELRQATEDLLAGR